MSNRNSKLVRRPNPNTMDYLKLHKHIAKRYDIYLFEDEIKEIVDIVLEMHNEKPETCTMKTAMQEMFEELYAHSFEIPIGLLAKCEELMAKEKEQIVNAYKEGCYDGGFFDEKWDEVRAKEYYGETYTNPDQV